MEGLFSTENLVALLTLTTLEIILGIDNVIFIAILSAKLPKEQQHKARQIGIALAVISRIMLLFSIKYIVDNLTDPVLFDRLSGKDLILLGGGLFLIAKSTYEIHEKLEGHAGGHGSGGKVATLAGVLVQIMIIDLVFSLDSVITAVGIAESRAVMVIAILIASALMVLASNTIANFVEEHPTFKILALAFLIMIGAILVFEGWDHHAAEEVGVKNYVYFAMAFSIIIEVINMKFRKNNKPVQLKRSHLPE